MKRRVLSLTITLALCLNLCPVWVLAADEGDGLCPHHTAHTDGCGYVSPSLGQECTHNHNDSCYTTETACSHEHDGTCGYAPENPGAPCTFVCRICPIEDLIGKLPRSVSEQNSERVQAQLSEIYALYDELTSDEQRQVDLSPCAALLYQIDGMETNVLSDTSGSSSLPPEKWVLDGNKNFEDPYDVSTPYVIDTNGHTLYGAGSSVIRVTGTGVLELKGKIVSNSSAGVKVETDGSLNITEAGTNIQCLTYALDIASGANVQLSAGTYFGKTAAIYQEDNDFAALLAPGCAYFDGNGNPIRLTNVATAKEVVVKQCTGHSKTYTRNADSPTHTWTCAYCGLTEKEEKCTFTSYNSTGTSTCDLCGNELTVAVTRDSLKDLAYDDTVKPKNGAVTVKVKDAAAALVENTDYTVSYSTRAAVGNTDITVTVKVEGIAYNGTFEQEYTFTAAELTNPVLQWDSTSDVSVDYTGSKVTKDKLPGVTVNITTSSGADLHDQLQYFYRIPGSGSAYTDGLPTNAGTYDVVVTLPEGPDYQAASSAPITLVINKIDPIATPPAAANLTFNGAAQELAVAGTLEPAAAGDGAVILYATSKNGEYSTSIPTGTNAGRYTVYYKVDGTTNYDGVTGTPISVTIDPKPVSPKIELSQTSYPYDGSKKEPKITVKDGDTVIGEDQYTVTWTGNPSPVNDNDMLRVVGTYTATIKNVDSGNNYTFSETVTVEITPATQTSLTITGKPEHVYYGDTFMLDTTGGSGNGTVTWSITAGGATIEPTGEITVTDTGSVTVEAKRTVPNYGTVSGTLIFTVEPKPVTAEVTVADKVYDGTTAATVTKVGVKASDLVDGSDVVTFDVSKFAAAFDDVNAGTNKTVTVNSSAASAGGAAADKYTVSYPASVTADITPRRVTVTVELSGSDLQTDNSATPPDYSYTYDGTDKTPAVKVTGTDTNGYSAVLTASDYDVTYSNNKNVGNAAVTVRSKAGGNYTFPDTPVQFAIKKAEARLTSSPLPNDLTYTGQSLALVTAGTATGGHIEYSTDGTNYSASIPTGTDAGSYKVYYKVVGDGNHAGSTEPVQIPVTIKPKPVNPAITLTLTADPMIYTGSPLKPDVTVTVEGKPLDKDTDYTVTYSGNTEPGTATVTVQSVSGINYQFYATETFTIAKAKATFAVLPTGNTLTYNGTAQELIKENTGTSLQGIVLYSLDAQTYSAEIPTATKARTYTVYAKIQGDSTHADSDVFKISAKIAANDGTNLNIILSDNNLNYTGSALQPTVTVTDNSGNEIPVSDYTVSYSDNINVGKATVTVTGKAPNCTFTNTASFTIVGADQPKLSITGQPDKVFYGDTFQLGTTGGSASGTVTWTSSDTDVATVANGVVTVKKAGNTVIKASMDSGGNYTGPAEASWTLIARPKPLGITVLAADKPYNTADSTAVLTVVVNSSDWVSSSDIGTITATGHFLNMRVGDNQTVIIDTLTLPSGLSDKYTVANPGTTTASITPVSASVTGAPTARTLTYNGSEQALIDASGCTAEGGDLAYSLDGVSYNYIVPTGKDAGKYTFWYKALADENHKDSTPVKIEVEIAANTGKPTVKCSPASLPYDNTEKTPTVIVLDADGREIPSSEYTVTLPSPRIAKGDYEVTVTIKGTGNYKFDTPVKGTFTITAADQSPLSIISSTPTNVHYGDTFRLSASGGSGSGAIQWKSTDQSVATIDGNGVVEVIGTGSFTVEAYREAAGGYNQSETATLPFYADPKSVTPVVTADDKSFDGKTDATLHASWKAGDLVGNDADAITLTVTGQFVTPDVGTGKQVKVTSGTPSGGTGNYIITWPDSTTASIYRVNAELETRPGKRDLTYTGAAHPLLTGGTMKGDGKIGTIVYSLSEKGEYSETIPTGTNAGTYEVWYKVADSVNYMGIPATSIEVEIKKATPEIVTNPVASGTAGQKLSEIALNGGAANGVSGSISGIFDWVNGDIEATDGTPYNVIFTPDDTVNYNTKTFVVTVTVTAAAGGSGGGTDDTGNNSGSASTTNAGGGSGTNSTSSVNTASTRTTVRNGTASTVLSASDGSKLVRQAAANQSQSIVIKPEITGSVTKTQVSIPASTVSQIRSETNAALTVSAPIADVTIPNAALDTLSSAGGAVNVVTEQADQSVVLTLTAGGENVENVPVTLSVPAEDAGPGTVAVLVHEDGTRETIRKSVVEDGRVNIPLNGSATVEIVDNSKEFTDVPSTSWAADAVAFASAHELFSGTSETTFSPDQAMSRGMLATVLYSLEGRPDQDADLKFSDVGSDTWYADGIAWATENGIASGYGNGQFGPDDSITREQFAVMLWKYAGSPKASGQTLDFTDADQASSYAREALCWATENGILNGYTDGQLAPGKTATRAQAAQMLKNFMENA